MVAKKAAAPAARPLFCDFARLQVKPPTAKLATDEITIFCIKEVFCFFGLSSFSDRPFWKLTLAALGTFYSTTISLTCFSTFSSTSLFGCAGVSYTGGNTGFTSEVLGLRLTETTSFSGCSSGFSCSMTIGF